MVNPGVLRVGVVGVGLRAEIARHVAESGVAAELVAASDPDERGRARAREMFGDLEIVAGHQELANLVDAAIVTSPDWTHAEIAVDLLRAGVAVYLEKPLATTLPDADAVLAAAQETGAKLYIGHNFRHSAVVRTLRDVVTRGEIGEVKTVWCRHFVGNGGDYYFKDWHADRSRVNSLLLQKASHDLDVIHYLAGGFTRRVTAMGDLAVYGKITDRGGQGDRLADDWFSFGNWPPAAQTGLNPVVDVEDLSMVHLRLDNGVLASYEQCHFTPDYWRNYTVIGTEGRAENFGDTGGGVVKVWNRRRNWARDGDREYPIDGVASGHEDADLLTMKEFLRYAVHGDPPELSPIAAREAVAAGALATESLRSGSVPIDVPPLPEKVAAHFCPPEGNRR
ncbi:Gfo/Idh/MocA family oxidoreductase [Amycolatopsis sp. FU40]|uniref:Gfo/Idh/MocA family protein n=1 Tax=Amycolatopsis sp. FU40 TaxID=2914159 RepID=UPI001F2FD07A|nr:Gfo/Idh/MocA family oxidoreductase [Amycolatopsis sp. FU40]UKD56729.1 Gfo/Idh/MocA family oxidoreductase [Amycolatopsis sp. FU40]